MVECPKCGGSEVKVIYKDGLRKLTCIKCRYRFTKEDCYKLAFPSIIPLSTFAKVIDDKEALFHIDEIMITNGMVRVFCEDKMTALLKHMGIEFDAEYWHGEFRDSGGEFYLKDGKISITCDGLFRDDNKMTVEKTIPEQMLLKIFKAMLSYSITENFAMKKLKLDKIGVTICSPYGFLVNRSENKDKFLSENEKLVKKLWEKVKKCKTVQEFLDAKNEYDDKHNEILNKYILKEDKDGRNE